MIMKIHIEYEFMYYFKGLGDRNEAVRREMLSAAVTTIDLHGKVAYSDILLLFLVHVFVFFLVCLSNLIYL